MADSSTIKDHVPEEVRRVEAFLNNASNVNDKCYVIKNLEAIREHNESPFEYFKFLVNNVANEKYVNINFDEAIPFSNVPSEFLEHNDGLPSQHVGCASVVSPDHRKHSNLSTDIENIIPSEDADNENAVLAEYTDSEIPVSFQHTDSEITASSEHTDSENGVPCEHTETKKPLVNEIGNIEYKENTPTLSSHHSDLLNELQKYFYLRQNVLKNNEDATKVILISANILRKLYENTEPVDKVLSKKKFKIRHRWGLRDEYMKPRINFEKYAGRFKDPKGCSESQEAPKTISKNENTLDAALGLLLLRVTDYKKTLLENGHYIKAAMLCDQTYLIAELKAAIKTVDLVVNCFKEDFLTTVLEMDLGLDKTGEKQKSAEILKAIPPKIEIVSEKQGTDILQKAINNIYTLKKRIKSLSSKTKHLRIYDYSAVKQTSFRLQQTLLELKVISKVLFFNTPTSGEEGDIAGITITSVDNPDNIKSSKASCSHDSGNVSIGSSSLKSSSDMNSSRSNDSTTQQFETFNHMGTAMKIGHRFEELGSKMEDLRLLVSQMTNFHMSSDNINLIAEPLKAKDKNTGSISNSAKLLSGLSLDKTFLNKMEDPLSDFIKETNIFNLEHQINEIIENAKSKLAILAQNKLLHPGHHDASDDKSDTTRSKDIPDKISTDYSIQCKENYDKNVENSTGTFLNYSTDDTRLLINEKSKHTTTYKPSRSGKSDETGKYYKSNDSTSSYEDDADWSSADDNLESFTERCGEKAFCQVCNVSFNNDKELSLHLRSVYHKTKVFAGKEVTLKPILLARIRGPAYNILNTIIPIKSGIMCLACDTQMDFDRFIHKIHIARTQHYNNVDLFNAQLQRDHIKLHFGLFKKFGIVMSDELISKHKVFFDPISAVCYCCTCERKIAPNQTAIDIHVLDPEHLRQMVSSTKKIEHQNEAKNVYCKLLKKNQISENSNLCNACQVNLNRTVDDVLYHVKTRSHIDNLSFIKKSKKNPQVVSQVVEKTDKVQEIVNKARKDEKGKQTKKKGKNSFIEVLMCKKEYILNSLICGSRNGLIKCRACKIEFSYHRLLLPYHITSYEHVTKLDTYYKSEQMKLLQSFPQLFLDMKIDITEEMIMEDKIYVDSITEAMFCGICQNEVSSVKEIAGHIISQKHVDEKLHCTKRIAKRQKAKQKYEHQLLSNGILPVNYDNGICFICEGKIENCLLLRHCDKRYHMEALAGIKEHNEMHLENIVKHIKAVLEENYDSSDETSAESVSSASCKFDPSDELQMEGVFLKRNHILLVKEKYFCKVCECYIVTGQGLLLAHTNSMKHIKKMAAYEKKPKIIVKNSGTTSPSSIAEQIGPSDSRGKTVELSTILSRIECNDTTEGSYSENIFASTDKVLFDTDSFGWIERERQFEESLAKNGWYVDIHRLCVYMNKVECTVCEVSLPIHDLIINLHITSDSHVSKVLLYNDRMKINLQGNCRQEASPTGRSIKTRSQYCSCRTCSVELTRCLKSTWSLSSKRIQKSKKQMEDRYSRYIDVNKIMRDEDSVVCIVCEEDIIEDGPLAIIEHIEYTSHYENLNNFHAKTQRELIAKNPNAYGINKIFNLTDKHIDSDCIYANHISKQVYCGVCRCELYPHQRLIDFHVSGKMHRRNFKDLRMMANGTVDMNESLECEEDDDDNITKDFISFMQDFIGDLTVEDPQGKRDIQAVDKEESNFLEYETKGGNPVLENPRSQVVDSDSGGFNHIFEKTTFKSKKYLYEKFLGWLNGNPIQSFTNECKTIQLINRNECKPIQSVKMNENKPIHPNNVDECKPIQSIDVNEFIHIQSIDVNECKPIQSIDENGCKPIQSIDVNECKPIQSIDVNEYKPIQSIGVNECKPIQSIDENGCKSIQSINVNECKPIQSIDENERKPIQLIDENECKSIQLIDENESFENECILNEKTDTKNCDIKIESHSNTEYKCSKNDASQSKSISRKNISSSQEKEECIYPVVDLKMNKLFQCWTDEDTIKCIPCDVIFLNNPESITVHVRSSQHVFNLYEAYYKSCNNIVTKEFCFAVSDQMWTGKAFVVDAEWIYVDFEDNYACCCLCGIRLDSCEKVTVMGHIGTVKHSIYSKSKEMKKNSPEKVSAIINKRNSNVSNIQQIDNSSEKLTMHDDTPQNNQKFNSNDLQCKDTVLYNVVQLLPQNNSPQLKNIDAKAINAPGIRRLNDNTFSCDLCKIKSINGAMSVKQHVNGRRHQDACSQMETNLRQQKSVAQNTNVITSPGIRNLNKNVFACDICNIKCINGTISVEMHINGSLHQKSCRQIEKLDRVEQKTNVDRSFSKIPGIRRLNDNMFTCIFCDVKCLYGDDNVVNHLNSDLHKKSSRALLHTTSPKQPITDNNAATTAPGIRRLTHNTFACDLCDIKYICGDESVAQHLKGILHRTSRKKVNEFVSQNRSTSDSSGSVDVTKIPGIKQLAYNKFACDLCNVPRIYGHKCVTQHIDGAAHRENVLLLNKKQNPASEIHLVEEVNYEVTDTPGIRRFDQNTFRCDLCDGRLISGERNARQHAVGAAHLASFAKKISGVADFGRHQCGICKIKGLNDDEFTKHRNIGHNESDPFKKPKTFAEIYRYKCDICSIKDINYETFATHLNGTACVKNGMKISNFAKVNKYKCNFCKINNLDYETYVDHKTRHNTLPNKTLISNAKDETNANSNLFESGVNVPGIGFLHGMKKINPTMYVCDFCKINVWNISNLMEHVKSKKHFAKVKLYEETLNAARSLTNQNCKPLQNNCTKSIVSSENNVAPTTKSNKPEQKIIKNDELYVCQICKIHRKMSKSDYMSHIDGKAHQKMLRKLNVNPEPMESYEKIAEKGTQPEPELTKGESVQSVTPKVWDVAIRKTLCEFLGIEWPDTLMSMEEIDNFIESTLEKTQTSSKPEAKVCKDNIKVMEKSVATTQNTENKAAVKKPRSRNAALKEMNKGFTAKDRMNLTEEIMVTLEADENVRDVVSIQRIMSNSKILKICSPGTWDMFKCSVCDARISGVLEGYAHLKNAKHGRPYAVDCIEEIRDGYYECWLCQEDLSGVEEVEEHMRESNHLKNTRI